MCIIIIIIRRIYDIRVSNTIHSVIMAGWSMNVTGLGNGCCEES